MKDVISKFETARLDCHSREHKPVLTPVTSSSSWSSHQLLVREIHTEKAHIGFSALIFIIKLCKIQ